MVGNVGMPMTKAQIGTLTVIDGHGDVSRRDLPTINQCLDLRSPREHNMHARNFWMHARNFWRCFVTATDRLVHARRESAGRMFRPVSVPFLGPARADRARVQLLTIQASEGR